MISDPNRRAIIEVPGDGHCLLYAWEIALNVSEVAEMKPTYEELKNLVIQDFASYGDDHRDFLCDNEVPYVLIY